MPRLGDRPECIAFTQTSITSIWSTQGLQIGTRKIYKLG